MTNETNHKKGLFWLAVSVIFITFLVAIKSILLPFVLGIFIAYFLDPAADRLERSGLSRTNATLVITGGFFLNIIALSILIVPIIATQFSGLIAALPEFISRFDTEVTPQLTHWLGALPAEHMESIKSATANFSGAMVSWLGEFAGNIFQSGMAIINLLSLILITPIVAFYMLRDWDEITARIDKLLPRPHAVTIREQLAIIDATLAGFIRGQLNVCLLLGAFYALGLSLVGLKFGIVIGLATGLLVIVPYVGFMICFIIGMAVAFFQFDTAQDIGMVLAVFLTGQVIESYFVTPRLVGEKVGLHPVWIIFGMLAGAALFGFVGVLLAVPVTAVVGVLIRFAVARYLESSYYQGEPKKARPKA